jgi:hypothetical protein
MVPPKHPTFRSAIMANHFDKPIVIVYRQKRRGTWKTLTAYVPPFAIKRFIAKIRDSGGKILSEQ